MSRDQELIDWELSIRVIGKKEFAEQMIHQFIDRLPHDLTELKEMHLKQNYGEMWALVHKLHGALCYCVLPRLKNVIEQLERELKNNIMVGLPSLLTQLDNEVKLILKHHSILSQDA